VNHNFRILVVDDQPSVLLTYTLILQQAGYAVTAASTCAAALQHLGEKEYDLLLCDLGLDDGRSGIEVIEFAQEHRPRMSSVLLTGYSTPEVVEEAKQRGITLLFKPLQVRELLRTLEALAMAAHGAA